MDDVRSRYSVEPVHGYTWVVVLVAGLTSALSIAALELLVRRGAAPAYSKNLHSGKVQTAAQEAQAVPPTPSTAETKLLSLGQSRRVAAPADAPPANVLAQAPAPSQTAVAPQPPSTLQQQPPESQPPPSAHTAAGALTVDAARRSSAELNERSVELRKQMSAAAAAQDFDEAARIKKEVTRVEERAKLMAAVAKEDYEEAARLKAASSSLELQQDEA
mmetsp:Transcript_52423/g.137916  ORF Transcript_52423/g.137916 Transcript_52423/m.137916 type:complete len:218 (-) Transcript_52423:105-758(-)